jgi:ABC-type nitrate/sulfonate/bicarbonate transport system substrate-binding protein
MRASRATFLTATGALAITPVMARASAIPVRMIGFFSSGTLPYWVADAQGFFAREGLAVSMTPAPGSVAQFTRLSAGEFDIATTAIDNIIAYDEGQGEATLPNPADFVAIMGGDPGFLQLWARPEITGYADLKGKLLAVDALTTGYAFVLRKMLEKHGIRGSDYALEAVGNTAQRFARMQRGTDCVAALISPPFDVNARAAGFRFLDHATDVIGPYQGGTLVARRAWLAQNRDVAVRFIRAVRAGLRWLFEPANRDAAAALLAERTKIALPAAASLLPSLLDPKNGLVPSGAIDPSGVANVLSLRTEYALPHKTLGTLSGYYDGSFFAQSETAH